MYTVQNCNIMGPKKHIFRVTRRGNNEWNLEIVSTINIWIGPVLIMAPYWEILSMYAVQKCKNEDGF